MKKYFVIFLFILILFSGCKLPPRPWVNKRPASPEGVVNEFYELYFDCLQNEQVTMLDTCLETQIGRPYFTKQNREKVAEVVSNEHEPDYDPLLCARNIPGYGYGVGTASISGNLADLVVTFKYGQEEHRVPIKLIQEKEIWNIDDIDCSAFLKSNN